MASDAVLTRDGPVAAPLSYVVPQGGELQPLTVRATVDGTSAAVAYYATVQVVAPSGRIMGNYITNSIAAGASADVTWFRHLSCPPPSTLFPNNNHTTTALQFGPWAYWKCNEHPGALTALDSSGHGRTMAVNTSVVTFGATGLIPTSSDTSAHCLSSAVVSTTYLASQATQTYTASVISLEVWTACGASTGADNSLVALGSITSAATNLWWLRLSAGKPVFITSTGAAFTTYSLNSNDLRDSATHQIVVVMDGTHITCYVDNVQTDQQAQTASLGVPKTFTAYINQVPGGAGARSNPGNMGPVGVYDSALSSANVASLWNAATVLSP